MSNFKAGVVIPVGPGRHDNLNMVLESLLAQSRQIKRIVLVYDGPEATHAAAGVPLEYGSSDHLVIDTVTCPERHRPGLEQPRNVGVRALPEDFTHAWFVDSDVILDPDAHAAYERAWMMDHRQRILIGPYDWLEPGVRNFEWGSLKMMHNDPRWVSFREHTPSYVSTRKLNDGLACFSGNLMWPIEEFRRVGGFWNDIHHGRCEDGELGLRAVSEGVPISFVRDARGYHLWHPINGQLAVERNARDVPMLNARHPWVEAGGLRMVAKDGVRFDQICPHCGDLINTIEYWNHEAAHRARQGYAQAILDGAS